MILVFNTIGEPYIFKVAGKEDIATEGIETAEDFGDWLLRTKQITKSEYIEKTMGYKKRFENNI